MVLCVVRSGEGMEFKYIAVATRHQVELHVSESTYREVLFPAVFKGVIRPCLVLFARHHLHARWHSECRGSSLLLVFKEGS